MSQKNAVIAVYETHAGAEEALKELQRSGFDMKKLSIAGRDYQTEEQVVGYYNTGDRMKAWGKAGAFWGGLWGMLFGSAMFLSPGFGPLLAAGPIVVPKLLTPPAKLNRCEPVFGSPIAIASGLAAVCCSEYPRPIINKPVINK